MIANTFERIKVAVPLLLLPWNRRTIRSFVTRVASRGAAKMACRRIDQVHRVG
jgi:hypothetical protein